MDFKDMKPKLVGIQLLLIAFTIAIIIISVTSVIPAMTGDIDIDIPSEDEIRWDIQDDNLYLRGDMWVNNSGYYSMEDINIAVEVLGFNRTLFEDNINIPSVERGEDKKIELVLQTSLDDFTDDELRELVFADEEENEKLDLRIVSDMNARYPFSIVGFNLDYESIIEWEGLVKTFEYHEDEIEFHSTDRETVVSLPYTVETSDYLSGDSIVDLWLLDEGTNEEYSHTQLTVPLGVYESDTADFVLEGSDIIEDFIFNDKNLIISSEVNFSEFGMKFEEEERYHWEAPVEELDFLFDEASVTSSNGQSSLILPYLVQTRNLDGNAIVEITMLDESKTRVYSTDLETIQLGTHYTDQFIFPLNEEDTVEFIINSQLLFFDIDITLEENDIRFNTEETHKWGAPLNELEVDYIQYCPIEKRAEGNFSFINDSPRELDLTIDIIVYDEYDDYIDSITEYFIVEAGEEFEGVLEADIDEIPAYAEITFIDNNTGMEYEKEVDVDE